MRKSAKTVIQLATLRPAAGAFCAAVNILQKGLRPGIWAGLDAQAFRLALKSNLNGQFYP